MLPKTVKAVLAFLLRFSADHTSDLHSHAALRSRIPGFTCHTCVDC